MIKPAIRVAGIIGVSAISAFASGVADMSGTTFTQQLHAQSGSSSMLPMFAILFVGAMFLVSMGRDQIRQWIPAGISRKQPNKHS